MNPIRQSPNDDLPMAITLLAMSTNKVGCLISDQGRFSIGVGDPPELDAIAKFGMTLSMATMYVTRPPEEMILKFLERCGLRRVVIMQDQPPGYTRQYGVEYAGSGLNRLRDTVRALEQKAI